MQKTAKIKPIKGKTTPKKASKKTLNEVFFYDKTKLIYLVLFNIFLTCVVLKIFFCLLSIGYTCCSAIIIMLAIITILATMALLGSLYVTIFPQRLALLTDTGITIDHNEELKWDEIKEATEFVATYIYKQNAIALHTKDGVSHNLRFMQKMCKNNIFTPFSIPLYAMRKKDADKIRKLIKQKCKYKNMK